MMIFRPLGSLLGSQGTSIRPPRASLRLPNCTVDPNYTWSPPTTTTEAPPGEISAGWRVRLAIVYLVLIGLV